MRRGLVCGPRSNGVRRLNKPTRKRRLPMTAARAAFLGGAFGGGCGGGVGGGIAEFFAGPGTHGLLWGAALIGAIVAGACRALAARSSLCKPADSAASPGQTPH